MSPISSPARCHAARWALANSSGAGNTWERHAAPGTTVSVRDWERGPASIESSAEEYLSIPGLLEAAPILEAGGQPRHHRGLFRRSGAERGREMVTSIPVVGPGQAERPPRRAAGFALRGAHGGGRGRPGDPAHRCAGTALDGFLSGDMGGGRAGARTARPSRQGGGRAGARRAAGGEGWGGRPRAGLHDDGVPGRGGRSAAEPGRTRGEPRWWPR